MDELNNLASAGTETVETPYDDNAELTTYWDPDEDEDTPDVDDVAATDDGSEGEAEEAEPADDEAEVEASAAPEARVELANGEKVTVAELVKGYQRQSDYTRKSQENANIRRDLEAHANRINGINEAVIEHLTSLVPQPPSEALALQNPGAYIAQKAQYDAAVAQLQKLIEVGGQSKQVTESLTREARGQIAAQERQALIERFPEIATKDGEAKFFSGVSDVAQELGFSAEELSGVLDHRVFTLAHYARIGMEAMKARQAAKAKAAKAPPASPVKPGRATDAKRNVDAMRKLARSGSIHDAMKVDWD